jgi:hypothetical protein
MIFYNAQYLEHRDPRPHALPTSLGKFSHIRLRNIATCNKKRPFARFLALPDPSKLIESIEDVDWLRSLKELVAICNKPVHIYIGTYISIKCTTWKELQMQK